MTINTLKRIRKTTELYGLEYLIEQNNVGQNFRRTKFFVGQNFRHHRKISSLLSDEKFCPFLIFLVSFKHQLVIIYSVKINVMNKTLYPEQIYFPISYQR